jgi:hypothetical protein
MNFDVKQQQQQHQRQQQHISRRGKNNSEKPYATTIFSHITYLVIKALIFSAFWVNLHLPFTL